LGCYTGRVKLPVFKERHFKPTDIIPKERLKEAVFLYHKGKINTFSFQSAVKDFERGALSQLTHVKTITPQFFLELESKLHKIYDFTEKFSPVKSDGVNYLEKTFLRLWLHMLSNMSLSDVSEVLKVYYGGLKVKPRHYDFNYSLDIVETIIAYFKTIEEKAVERKELLQVKSNIQKAKSTFKNKSIRLGLRRSLKTLNDIIFLLDERLLEIELIKKEIKKGRRLFIVNDSSLKLIATIKELKNNFMVSAVDYPYLLGNGYVKVFPTKTYTVRQYGKHKNKKYVFNAKTFRYKVSTERWVWGTYEFKNGSMITKIGRYAIVLEVYRINDKAYLLDGEILITEE